jgi:hypothetical protein
MFRLQAPKGPAASSAPPLLLLVAVLQACGGNAGEVSADTNVPTTTRAGDCLYPTAMLMPGSNVSWEIRTTDGAGQVSSTASISQSVVGGVDFLGVPRTEVVKREVSSFDSNGRVERQYIERSSDSVIIYGSGYEDVWSDANGVTTFREVTSVYDPPAVLALDFGARGSTAVGSALTSAGSVVTNGIRTALEPITTTTVATYVFVGVEEITVPAGTYKTCRFDIRTHTSRVVHWYVVGVGVPAQTEHYFANEEEPVVGVSRATVILVNGTPISNSF